jgi:hypothetical protein
LKIGTGIGLTVDSTVTESIAILRPWIATPAGVFLSADIYNAASVGDTVLGGIDAPGVIVATSAGFQKTDDNGSTWTTYSGGVPYVNRRIPDFYTPNEIGFLVSGSGQYIRYNPAGSQSEGHFSWQGTGSYIKAEDGTAGNSPVGKRIGWIEVTVVAKAHNGASGTLDGVLRIGGVNRGSDDGPQRVIGDWKRYTYKFLWNPATGTQWFASDLATFNSGGVNSFGFSMTGKTPIEWWIGAVNIVFRSVPEHRLATGYVTPGAGGAFASMTLLNPADGVVTPWAKASGTKYLAVFFLTGLGGSGSLNGVDQASLAEAPNGQLGGWLGADLPTYPNSPIPTGPGSASSWAPSVVLETTAPAQSVDSQPYVQPKVMRVHSTDGPGDNQEQLAAHSTDDYAMVRFVVGLFDELGAVSVPTDVLVVQIVDDVGDPVGGVIELAPEEVPADGRWHLLARRLDSSAALSSGSTYFLTFSTEGTPWSVAYADVIDATEAGPPIEAGGTVNGVSGATDLLSNVGTVPPPLAGVTGEVLGFDQGPIPAGGPATMAFAQIEWDSSSLGDDFGYYELQRDEEPIAYINDEGQNAFDDFGALRNAPSYYRARVVRADGATSDWSDTIELVVPTAAGCDLIFSTSNGALGFQEVGDADPVHVFQRANADGVVFHKIAGRRAPAGFRPQIEGNSDVFTRTIIVNMDVPGVPVPEYAIDRFAFDSLLSLIEESLQDPYVTVCDGHGYRWYALVEFVQGSYTWKGHEHQTDVKITEVATTAIPVVIAAEAV